MPDPHFVNVANLYAPKTIDACFEHSGTGPVPGVKEEVEDADGRITVSWNTTGHAQRIITVTEVELAMFARLYDMPGTHPLEARLPALHARPLANVLRKFADHPKRLGDLEGRFVSTEMFHETYAQRDGTTRRETRFPGGTHEWMLSGPHFSVGNPFHQTPRAVSDTNRAYDRVDLEFLTDDYLPRTNYVPACSADEFRARTPQVTWSDPSDVGPMLPERVTS